MEEEAKISSSSSPPPAASATSTNPSSFANTSSNANANTNANASSGSSRWNPTKEQISILEGLYKQGIRTPSAEQIQQITGKLREYGAIEGKNVFYWFQNHKARQRQKQKQETFAYFSRLLHHAPPPPPPPPQALSPPPPPSSLSHAPPCTNVLMCGPYNVATPHVHGIGGVGIYQPHHSTMFMSPEALKRWPKPQGFQGTLMPPVDQYYHNYSTSSSHGHTVGGDNANNNGHNIGDDDDDRVDNMGHETLQLFPVHPTGVLEKSSRNSVTSTATTEAAESLEEEEEEEEEEMMMSDNGNQLTKPFFDFFGGAN